MHATQSGFSNLLLVLILAILLTLLMAPMMYIARFQARQANSSVQSQKAFFEAEGALAASLKLLEASGSTGGPSFGPGSAVGLPDGETVYTVGDTEITRVVETDPITGTRTVSVTADTNGYKRKLVAEIEQEFKEVATESGEREPLDIAFALDFSGSMGFDGAEKFPTDLSGLPVPLVELKKAMIQFVNSEEFTAEDRIGYTTYAKQARKRLPVDFLTDKAAFADEIKYIGFDSGTNAAHGLALAYEQLRDAPKRVDGKEGKKVIILFADGSSGHSANLNLLGPSESTYKSCDDGFNDSSCSATGCKPWVEPLLAHGTQCTDELINLASVIKSQGISIYSVMYRNEAFLKGINEHRHGVGTPKAIQKAKEEAELAIASMKAVATGNQYTEVIDITSLGTALENIQYEVIESAAKIREVVPE